MEQKPLILEIEEAKAELVQAVNNASLQYARSLVAACGV